MKKKPVKKREVGRPSKFSDALANEILERISEGELLSVICREDHMPNRSTVFRWLIDPDRAEFSTAYTRAIQLQTEAWADQMIEDANDCMDGVNNQSRRLQIDTKKWIMARKHPKQWGDKIDVTTDGQKMDSAVKLFLPDNGRGGFDNNNLDK